MSLCEWAGCHNPAVRQDRDGHLHCRPHWRDHLALEAEENPRLCEKCGAHFQSRTVQRKFCDACRESRRRPDAKPCGTRAAFARHKERGETPCDACREAESAYHRERYLRRRAA